MRGWSNYFPFSEDEQQDYPVKLENGRVLRSRLSTSTLGSVKEERSSTSAKRKLPYFREERIKLSGVQVGGKKDFHFGVASTLRPTRRSRLLPLGSRKAMFRH